MSRCLLERPVRQIDRIDLGRLYDAETNRDGVHDPPNWRTLGPGIEQIIKMIGIEFQDLSARAAGV